MQPVKVPVVVSPGVLTPADGCPPMYIGRLRSTAELWPCVRHSVQHLRTGRRRAGGMEGEATLCNHLGVRCLLRRVVDGERSGVCGGPRCGDVMPLVVGDGDLVLHNIDSPGLGCAAACVE